MSDTYTIIGSFPALWTNWECSPVGYVLEDKKGKRFLSFDVQGNIRIRPQQLIEKIDEYRKAILATRLALDMLKVEENNVGT
jgi:hypothetical protein